jgi:hypothetical protein
MEGIVFNTGSGHVGLPCDFLACSPLDQVTARVGDDRGGCMNRGSAGAPLQGVDIRSAIRMATLIGCHSRMFEGNWTFTELMPPAQEREPA